MSKQFNYIDLFSGCGGLSLGLENSGFDLEMAVEKSEMAAETFFHNFIAKGSNDEDWKKYINTNKSVLDQARLEWTCSGVPHVYIPHSQQSRCGYL